MKRIVLCADGSWNKPERVSRELGAIIERQNAHELRLTKLKN